MYSNNFGDKKLSDIPFDELLDYQTNKALTGFVEEGGRGLRHAIRNAMEISIDWNKYCEEVKNNRKNKRKNNTKKS